MKRAFALICVLLLLAPHAAADGMMFVSDHDMWFLHPEENQMAAVHYEDGMENLLILVSAGGNFSGEHAVWIFPVPARPEQVKIDVLRGFPKMYGRDLEDEYQSAIAQTAGAQVIYATFPVCLLGGSPAVIVPFFAFGMAGCVQKSAEVQVHERVEKMGVTTEVVTATDAYALRNYLASLGMAGNEREQEILQNYIGKDYTFVVSYISNLTAYRGIAGDGAEYPGAFSGAVHADQVGVFCRFPVKEQIYYPLLPTSVYGDRRVPVILYVTGFADPVLYDGIRGDTHVTYFTEERFSAGNDLAPFFNGRTAIPALEYTKILIDAPSGRFTEDLWIDPEPPKAVVFRKGYIGHYPWIAVIAYIVFSMIASLAAGMWAFRKKPVDKKTLLIHGLWNCGTFIAMALATKKKFPQGEYGKRGWYILAFYFAFAALVSIQAVMLSPSLITGVLICWVLGLVAPVLAFMMVFVALMMIPSLLMNSLSLSSIMIIGWIIVLFIAGIVPVPFLIWLKRWIDPESLPPSPAEPESPPVP